MFGGFPLATNYIWDSIPTINVIRLDLSASRYLSVVDVLSDFDLSCCATAITAAAWSNPMQQYLFSGRNVDLCPGLGSNACTITSSALSSAILPPEEALQEGVHIQAMWTVLVEQCKTQETFAPDVDARMGHIDFMEHVYDGTVTLELTPDMYPAVPVQWPSDLPIRVQFSFFRRALKLLRRMRKYNFSRGYQLVAQNRASSTPTIRHFINSSVSSAIAEIH